MKDGIYKDRVAICVCTRKRPKMLAKCLESLNALLIPENVNPFIVVVFNEESQTPPVDIVQSTTNRIIVHKFIETNIGIPYARNRAMQEAFKLGADWIAFIGDDEVADRRWLLGLMDERYIDTPILQGHRIMVQEDGRVLKNKYGVEGEQRNTAATNNVRFRIELMALGFDTRYHFGSDTEFFHRAAENGFEIRYTREAVTYEKAHPERLTFFVQLQREYLSAIVSSRRLHDRYGRLRVFVTKGIPVVLYSFVGMFEIAASLFTLGRIREKLLLSGGKKFAKAFGRIACLVGRYPKPYDNVVGD